MRSGYRAANVRENPTEIRERLADTKLAAAELGREMIDIRIASKGIIETVRDRIAELEELEASGAAMPDSCEELVDLHEFLGRLYAIALEYASRTSH